MRYQRLITTISELNRKTSLFQFILICIGAVFFVFNQTLSFFLLNLLWNIFPMSDSEKFSVKYLIAIILIPFCIVKAIFLLIGILKYFYDKLWT